jgi:gamma-glutamyltranspeptidase/glutathione hydrolase
MPMPRNIPAASWRPTVAGSHYAASTGHALATAAAMRILDQGGNAIDAGVTAAMALAVLQPDVVSFGGVAPTLIYLKEEQRVVSLAGLGYWPAQVDVEVLRAAGNGHVPEGIMRQIVPAAPATHLEALRRYGTITFEQAASAAFELARDGFYVYPALHEVLEMQGANIDRFAENAAIFRPGGHAPSVGARLCQLNLAKTLFRMMEAERNASGDRDRKLRAVHDEFYRGSIAADICRFHAEQGGFIQADDLAGFEVPVEDSINCNYHDYQIHSCDVWCQGIVLLETLKILEGFDLRTFEHNSDAYLHLLAGALNLAFADREAYIGDPKFVDVPTAILLGDTYAASQRLRLDRSRAAGRMPEPGDLGTSEKAYPQRHARPSDSGEVLVSPDTIYAAVFDRYGNGYSATPSDTMYDSPMVPGLGFVVSSRGSQGRLEADHPASIMAGKRPRLTPSPAMALREGQLFMAWGTPGGDVQCQAMLQVFLNLVTYGLPMQQAVEAPRIGTFNFPNSFAPNTYHPGRLCIEDRIPPHTVEGLRQRGYDIQMWSSVEWSAGAVCALARDFSTGLIHAGADPRRTAYAAAW